MSLHLRFGAAARFAAGAALTSLVSVAAYAAEDSDHGEGGAGLPQLDISTWAGQAFWLLVIFGALYFVLSRMLLPNIGAVIEDRRDKIADDLDEAARLRQEADEAEKAFEKALADARAQAHTVADETRRRLQDEVARETEAFEAQADERAAQAEQRIAEMTREAMANASDIAKDAASAIVKSVTGKAPTAAKAKAAIAAAQEAKG